MARIAHILDHPGHGDNRVFRAAEAQKSAGHNVVIFALNRTGEIGPSAKDTGLEIQQCVFDNAKVIPFLSTISALRRGTTRGRTDKKPSNNPQKQSLSVQKSAPNWKRALGLLFWHKAAYRAVKSQVENFAPDIIHAHDLTMLPTGVKLAETLGIKLIYDSHEYERSRNQIISPHLDKIRMAFETKSISKVHAVICVSDSIADKLAEDYTIPRPQVIPNGAEGSVTHSYKRQSFNLPVTERLAAYFGSLQPGRGLSTAIEAIAMTPDWCLLIMGAANEMRYEQLRLLISQHNVQDRVFIRTPVAHDDVCNVMAICDATLIPLQNTCLSYDYALPNKLFQSIKAGVPVIVTPLKELSSFTKYFGVGTIAKGMTAHDISQALNQPHPKISTSDNELSPYSAEAIKKRYQTLTQSLLANEPILPTERLPHMR